MTYDWQELGAPPLVGHSLHRAMSLLGKVGLPQPKVRRVEGRAPRGQIIRQDPAPGTAFDPAAPLMLTVVDDNPIHHLPEVFREDDRQPTDSDGEERPPHMLANLLMMAQHHLSEVERGIDHMDEQLSPEDAIPAMLSWLGDRLPIAIEPDWSRDRVREVLRRAPELMAQRSTAAGLAELIRLRCGLEVKVVENAWPHGGVIAGQHRVGREATVATVPFEDEAFYVEIPPETEVDDGTVERLLQVIDDEKPVHLRCCVVRGPRPNIPPSPIPPAPLPPGPEEDEELWEITESFVPESDEGDEAPQEAQAPQADTAAHADDDPSTEDAFSLHLSSQPLTGDATDESDDAHQAEEPEAALEDDPFATPSEAPDADPADLVPDALMALAEPAQVEAIEAFDVDDLDLPTGELEELELDESGGLSARLQVLARQLRPQQEWDDDISLQLDYADTDDTLVRNVVEGLTDDDDDDDTDKEPGQ